MKSTNTKPVAVRGKYLNRLEEGSNVVLLDADLLADFPDSESVNQALRAFLAIGDEVQSVSVRPRRHGNGAKRPASFDPRKNGARKIPVSASR